MTTVTVQAPRVVVVSPQTPVSVETYRKGDKGDKGDTGAPGDFNVMEGEKASSTDAGTLFDMSITDDYGYLCTKTGIAGNAIWKKFVLFQT